MTEQPSTLKESLFQPEIIAEFAAVIQAVYPDFDRETFLSAVFDEGWEDRSLMDRMRHITTVLHDVLPAGYRPALQVLLEAFPQMPTSGFISLVPSDFVAVYGLDDLEASLPALALFTRPASAEFAVRPFIVRYPERMMAQMLAWADHPHPGVRRLASEGCRPRLPWGIRLQDLVADPRPILPILEKLKHDESESVCRSVANNLNDISKDHPDVTIQVLRRWQAEEPGDAQIEWITAHGLRTLVKAGDKEALELLGYAADPQIVVSDISVEPTTIAMGESIKLTYTITSTAAKEQKLMIDYIVYHLRANGELTPKVFKHKKVTIQPGEMLMVEKKHGFRPVTTRKYYPGRQAVQPQVNGRAYERIEFELTDE